MMSTYYAGLFADVGILLLGALSVYIILVTGQLSLGNAGFMAIGSYVASFLTAEHWALTPALIVAVCLRHRRDRRISCAAAQRHSISRSPRSASARWCAASF